MSKRRSERTGPRAGDPGWSGTNSSEGTKASGHFPLARIGPTPDFIYSSAKASPPSFLFIQSFVWKSLHRASGHLLPESSARLAGRVGNLIVPLHKDGRMSLNASSAMRIAMDNLQDISTSLHRSLIASLILHSESCVSRSTWTVPDFRLRNGSQLEEEIMKENIWSFALQGRRYS